MALIEEEVIGFVSELSLQFKMNRVAPAVPNELLRVVKRHAAQLTPDRLSGKLLPLVR